MIEKNDDFNVFVVVGAYCSTTDVASAYVICMCDKPTWEFHDSAG